MTKLQAVAEECEFCGRWCESGEWSVHHLFQRSIRPDLVNDPNNLITLCARCHQMATDSRKMELYMLEAFYGRTKRAGKQKCVDRAGGPTASWWPQLGEYA